MRRLVPLLLGLAACGGTGTEIVVLVRSDLATTSLGGAQIVVERIDGTQVFAQDCVDLHALAGWPEQPMTLGLLPGEGTRGAFRVAAEGFGACGQPEAIISDRAVVEFVDGARVALELALNAACAGVACIQGMTCDPTSGQCISETRGDLPSFTPDDMAASDDAAPPQDASGVDQAVAPPIEIAIAPDPNDQTSPVLADCGDEDILLDLENGQLFLRHLDVNGVGGGANLIDTDVEPALPAIACDRGSPRQGLILYTKGDVLNYAVLREDDLAFGGTVAGASTFYGAAWDPNANAVRFAHHDDGAGGQLRVDDVDFMGEVSFTSDVVGPQDGNAKALSIGGAGPGTVVAWQAGSGVLQTVLAGGAPMVVALSGLAPPLATTAVGKSFFVIGADANGKLSTQVTGASGAMSQVTSTVTAPTRLVAASDGVGGGFVVLENAGLLSLVPIDASGHLGALQILFGNDGYTRSGATIAYNASAGRYLVAYARRPTGGGNAQVYGFVHLP